ncbi:MAG: DUF4405 domain-containing protein [Phycisphaerales bacterium]|nr:DUF4405 domain-containing protein [Phycisphaerales bacterium]
MTMAAHMHVRHRKSFKDQSPHEKSGSNSGEPSFDRVSPRESRASRPRKKLSKSAINFIVDVVLLFSFMAVLWTTSVVQFVFPAGTQAVGYTLWGHSYDTWSSIQSGTIAVFAMLVLLHLILHWQWICAFITSRLSKLTGRRFLMGESSKTLYGVGTLIIVLTILGVLIVLAEFQIKPGDYSIHM